MKHIKKFNEKLDENSQKLSDRDQQKLHSLNAQRGNLIVAFGVNEIDYETLKIGLDDIEDDISQIIDNYNNTKIDEPTIMSRIEDIIHSEIYLRDVPYSMQDGDMEVDPDSAKDAAKSIIDMLKEDGFIK